MKRHGYLITAFVGLALALGVVGGAMAEGGRPQPPEQVGLQAAPGPGFTYQGQLKSSGSPVNDTCLFGFGLWDSSSGGGQLGVTQTVTTTVTNGLFTVTLNEAAEFGGSAFSGNTARYLGIGVKCGSESSLTNLGRQALTAAPYALYARNNWGLNGNSTSVSNILGTTNNMTLTLAVSNTAALRLVPNATSPNIIGGYSGNGVSSSLSGGATIAGGGASGFPNIVGYSYGTISGGYNNTAGGGVAATVGGGRSNMASGNYATVSGGDNNEAIIGDYATIGGGQSNLTSVDYATIGGGYFNNAGGQNATVGGGGSNTASGNSATISGGYSSQASGVAATIPGGYANIASGNYSFAAGVGARAIHNGAFVWADNSTSNPISSTTTNQFLVRASGGITMYTDSGATTGARLSPGSGTWASLSDRNVKANFAPVSGLDILNQLLALPIQTWNYQAQNASIRHIGPMAQDFYAAFNVGEDDTHITTIDADGVALAAIQGLYQVVQAKEAQITDLQARLSTQEQANADLQERVTALEQQSGKPIVIPSPPSPLPLGWLLFGGLLLINLGFLVGWNLKKGVRS